MKVIYLALLMAMLDGCSLFKRTTKSAGENKETSNLETKLTKDSEAEHRKESQFLNYRSNSIQSVYRFYLWPKGKMQFSTSSGFEGDFDSVVVMGKINQLTRLGTQNKINEDDKEQEKSTLNQHVESKNEKKNSLIRSFPDAKLIIAFFLLLGILAFWLFKRGFA